jgi:iron complex outermembrane receptor protein
MKINASYDYTQAIDDETDQQLIYVPKHRAGAILDYHYKRWKFNYNMQYVGKVYITTSNTQNLDAYWLSDVSFYRSIYKNNIGLALKINNIFDISYQSVAYRPMPNRNYSIQINFKI